MSKSNKAGLTSAELSSFCGQVAMILEAGLPLYDGMETLAGTAEGGDGADMYQSASKGVTETGSLYEALKQDSRWPDYLVEMVAIGERSGQLDKVMRGLEEYYAREDRVRASVVNAVTYPLVLGVLLVLIVLILLWKVLPVFQRTLSSMGVTLNESGAALMRVGSVVGWVVLALVVVALVVVLAGVILSKTKHRDAMLNAVGRMVPAITKVNKKLSASRVASVLSMMLSSGFPTEEALDMTEKVIEDKDAAAKVGGIKDGLNQGKTLADAIGDTGLFDPLHQRMIKMGSATGREDQVLGSLADLYEDQVEDGISRLVSIIEPTLVALLAIVIGAVLLSVMLPMAGILTSL